MNSLLSAWTIARFTYKELIRERLLYGILAVGLLVTAASFFLATISLDQDRRVLQNVGLASIHLFALLITVFMTASSIGRDFERRALYLLFPKPISRGSYVAGKYMGLLLLSLTALAILGGLFMAGLAATGYSSLLPTTLLNLAMSFLEISLIAAAALLFSTFAAPLNAALYASGLFIIGHSLGTVREFTAYQGNALSHRLITFFYYALPNLEKFNVRKSTLYGIELTAAEALWTLAYWAAYTSLLLWLAGRVMAKREV